MLFVHLKKLDCLGCLMALGSFDYFFISKNRKVSYKHLNWFPKIA